MIVEYRKSANKWLIVGFLVWLVGNIIWNVYQDSQINILGNLLYYAGMIVFIYGCMLYAKAKGHNQWLGLLGILSIIGLIILVLLPDRKKTK